VFGEKCASARVGVRFVVFTSRRVAEGAEREKCASARLGRVGLCPTTFHDLRPTIHGARQRNSPLSLHGIAEAPADECGEVRESAGALFPVVVSGDVFFGTDFSRFVI